MSSDKSPLEISAAVSHSRTHSSPSDLLSEVELAAQGGEGGPLSGKKPERNFADFNRDKLTVHQDLLVSRNPRRDSTELVVAVGGGGGGGTGQGGAPPGVMKSASFRRQRVRNAVRVLVFLKLPSPKESPIQN